MLAAPRFSPPVDGPVCVALSGGLDSHALLHAAVHHCTGPVRALHVNHGLQADADAWADRCAGYAAALGVPFAVETVVVDRKDGTGPEDAARRARHAGFERQLGPDEYLALAHHRDDQAETFLLRALRGAGPDGLAAMRPLRALGRGQLWRPWLAVARADIEAYARSHDLDWIDDPSNRDTRLDRNFVRHAVMPLLQTRWPQAAASLVQSAALCYEATGLLDDEDRRLLDGAASGAVLGIDHLLALPPARRARLLRAWVLERGQAPLPAAALARIERELLPARPDATARVDWPGGVLLAWRRTLHAGAPPAALPADWSEAWTGEHPVVLPGGGRLVLEPGQAFERPLTLASRRGGERIRLPGRSHRHLLKHVLQDRGIPPWERPALPLLWDGATLVAAGDAVLSAELDAWLAARGARLRHERAAGPSRAFD